MDKNKPISILLIEDDELQRSLIAKVLEAHDFNIVGEVGSGESGLYSFAETKPDVTLLDIQLIGMSGFECLEKILEENPKACVLMLSSNDAPQIIEECLDAGAYNFISKITPAVELPIKVKAHWKNFCDHHGLNR